MKHKRAVILLAIILIPLRLTPACGTVEWVVKTKIDLNTPPRDIAVSLNGKRVFVLKDKGELLVYSNDGTLEEKIEVSPYVDQIKVGPRDDLLYLGSRTNKTLEIVELDFIKKISTVGSPFKGPADAPVVVAVFDDFE
ncbi:MAG TPA: hypothetical protein VJZ49_03465 [Syntrophales bacterium]|nr:hypothetical protein [Syntrophales bacterium]